MQDVLRILTIVGLSFCVSLPLYFATICTGCTSAIQASLITFGLHDNSARPRLNQKLQSATLAFIATIFLSPPFIPPHRFQRVADVGA